MKITLKNTLMSLTKVLKLYKKKLGFELTKAIRKIIATLKAAISFGMYLSTRVGKPHSLEANFKGCYAINLSSNYRLIVEPICKTNSAEELDQCDEIIIKGVVDYHGKGNEWILP